MNAEHKKSGWSAFDQPGCISPQIAAAGLTAGRIVSSSTCPVHIPAVVQVH
jgi:hypothetical protein